MCGELLICVEKLVIRHTQVNATEAWAMSSTVVLDEYASDDIFIDLDSECSRVGSAHQPDQLANLAMDSMVVQTVTATARRGESPAGAIESRWPALPTP